LGISKNGDEYWSGEIKTLGKKSWTYGYFEVSARYPNVAGIWCQPFLVNAGGWPPEIDMGEPFTNNDHIQLAVYDADETPQTEDYYHPGLLGNWHKYAVWWKEDMIIWYIDDVEIWRTDYFIPTNPMAVYITARIGEYADPNDAELPDSMDVRYVRIWQR
jgi:beta-glucanase (GH16 family)